MLSKTHGIVFRAIPFGEFSIILHVFTEDFGLQSYLVHKAKKVKSLIPAGALQPLHLVELIAYHKNSGDLHRVKEIRNTPIYHDSPFNIFKASILLFLNEVLVKSVRQHQKDTTLYTFIVNALLWLDTSQNNPANFHLIFLLKLTRFLGFYPGNELPSENKSKSKPYYFDLKNGQFLRSPPLHPGYVGIPLAHHFYHFRSLNFEDGDRYAITREDRSKFLASILDFYTFHIEGLGGIKSVEILSQVFS